MTSEEFNPLSQFRIEPLPKAGYYIPEFITPELEASILQQVRKLPDSRWKVLSHRRLLSLPSPLTGTARDTLIDAPMPAYLTQTIIDRFLELQVFRNSPHGGPNHCLVNEYQPGQGIMPHEDGPAYFPITATISLASYTILNIYEKDENGKRETLPKWRILQEPRSLLVTTEEMYQNTIHGIDEIDRDDNLKSDSIANWSLLGDQTPFIQGTAQRETRVSLTYRDVLKVAKIGGALKFMTKR